MTAPRRARRASAGAVVIVALAMPTGAVPAAGELAATRALAARLSAAGRGEAVITVTLADPMGGPDRVQAGRLALEPPDRVRLDFPGTGERIVLRGEGGEWIQPEARQMVRLKREQAGMAAWLWEVLLKGGAGAFIERPMGGGRLALEPRDREAGVPGGISMVLDARGLPAQLELAEPGGGGTRYRFRGWRFSRPRGPGAFTLSAPRGYAVVDLP